MARNETKIEITAEDKTASAFASVGNRLLGVEQSFSKITGLVGGLSAAAAVGFVATSVKNAADFADEMGKAAQKVGTTTEALSALKYAADLSDVSFDLLQTGLAKLAKTTEDFRDGSKSASEAFSKINLDPTKFKDSSELFAAVADKISQMEDGARKTAIAQELLGKSGKDLIPLLNSGATGLKDMADEAERFGLVIDEKTSKAAEKFNDNMTRLSKLSEGASIQLGGPLVESLSKTTEEMIKSVAEGNKFLALLQGFAGLGKLPFDFFFSSDVDVSSKSRVKELEQDVIDLEQGILKLKKTGGGKANELAVGGSLDDLQKKLSVTKNQLEAFKKFSEQIDAKPAEKVEDKLTPEVIKPSAKSKSTGKSDAEKYAEDMVKLIKIFDDAAQPSQTLSEKLQAQLDTYTSLDPAVRRYAEGIIAQQNAQEALNIANQEWAEFAAVLDKSALRNINELESIQNDAEEIERQIILLERQREEYGLNATALEVLKDARLEATVAELEASKALIEDSELQESQLQAIDAKISALRRLRDLEKETQQETIKSSNLGKSLGLTFSSAFEDAVASGKKFSDVLKSLEQDLMKLLLRKTVTEPLFGGIENLISGFDFGSFFTPNANGNVYSSPSLSKYSGSVVSSPTMFAFANGAGLMGEAGAEGIFPLKRGRDGKLGVSAEGGSRANVTVNLIESPGNGGKVNQSQDGGNITIDVMVEKIESTMARNIGQGRGLAPVMERQYGLNRAAGSY